MIPSARRRPAYDSQDPVQGICESDRTCWERDGASGATSAPPEPRRASATSEIGSSVVAAINARWRVVDNPLQWILQRSKPGANSERSRWQSMMFFRSRKGLLHYLVDEPEAGECEPSALNVLRALPEWHP